MKALTKETSIPSELFVNGRASHEVANEVLEQAEEQLIDYRRLRA